MGRGGGARLRPNAALRAEQALDAPHRTDELRSGLSVIAGVYRDALVQGSLARPEAAVHAVHRIHQALQALDRNPNEGLLLQALLLELPSL